MATLRRSVVSYVVRRSPHDRVAFAVRSCGFRHAVVWLSTHGRVTVATIRELFSPKDISPSIGRQTVGILEFTNLKLKSNYLL